jgi:oligogalacturonide transport system permease protein
LSKKGKKIKKFEGLIYLLPWLIGLGVFTIYPFISSFILSFTNYNMIDSPKFIGLTNYINLFTKDPDFVQSLWATLKYTVFTVPTQLAFALFIAFILNFKLKGINMYRTAYYIPSILGGNIAIAVLWRFLWSGNGLINQVIQLFGGEPVGWLSDPHLAMVVIAILKVWQFGSAMVIFLAALKEIPVELYEAAQVDGAKKWTIFFRITLPMITPTVFFNLVMQLVNAFQEFNAPYLVTAGGPLKATTLTSLLIYNNAFKFFKMGYASAMSWVLFLIIMIFTVILFKTQNRWVYYSDGSEE